MSRKEDQIKMIEDLYASGSISDAEYNDMLLVVEKEHGKEHVVKSTSIDKKKLYKIIGILIAILLLLLWGIRSYIDNGNHSDESLKWVTKRCECENLLNNSVKRELNDIKSRISNNEFHFQNEVDEAVQLIIEKRSESKLTLDSRKCQGAFDALNKELIVKYPPGTKEGDLFWAKAEKKYASQQDYSSQEEIDQLLEQINETKELILFTSKEALEEAKTRVSNLLQAFFSSFGGYGFDANTWFSEEIEQFILSKHKNPEYINELFSNPNSDRQENQFQWIPASLSYIGNDELVSVWSCKVNYQCFRPSMQKYQYSLVTYEIKLDENQKIKSLRELKVENTRFEY